MHNSCLLINHIFQLWSLKVPTFYRIWVGSKQSIPFHIKLDLVDWMNISVRFIDQISLLKIEVPDNLIWTSHSKTKIIRIKSQRSHIGIFNIAQFLHIVLSKTLSSAQIPYSHISSMVSWGSKSWIRWYLHTWNSFIMSFVSCNCSFLPQVPNLDVRVWRSCDDEILILRCLARLDAPTMS